jgi:hypothetical protein
MKSEIALGSHVHDFLGSLVSIPKYYSASPPTQPT